MGVFKAVRRRTWKSAVNTEFHSKHGVDLKTLADVIGPATLDDLLNDQYEVNPHSPTVSVQNVTRILGQSFGLNIRLLSMHSRIEGMRALGQ